MGKEIYANLTALVSNYKPADFEYFGCSTTNKKASRTKVLRRSYAVGLADGFDRLAKESKKKRTLEGKSQALIIRKKEIALDYKTKTLPKLKASRSSKAKYTHGNSYSTGVKHGKEGRVGHLPTAS